MEDGNLEELQDDVRDEGSLRDRYLDLLQEIRSSKEEILEDRSRLDDLVSTSNMLFKKIRTSSELKLDAKVTAISTKLTCSRMEKDLDTNAITPKKLIELLENDLLDGFYKYGMGCSLGIRLLDRLSLVRGGDERKRRIQSQRQKLVPSEVKIPRSVTTAENITDESEVLAFLKRLLAEREMVEYFSCVTDPESFSRTVENIFCLSLAIRSGIASLAYNDDVLYVCSSRSPSGEENSEHLVLEISYDEYLEIVKKLKIKEALIRR